MKQTLEVEIGPRIWVRIPTEPEKNIGEPLIRFSAILEINSGLCNCRCSMNSGVEIGSGLCQIRAFSGFHEILDLAFRAKNNQTNFECPKSRTRIPTEITRFDPKRIDPKFPDQISTSVFMFHFPWTKFQIAYI